MREKNSWYTIEEIINEVEIFIGAFGRIPRTLNKDCDSKEYQLRIRYNNCVTRKPILAKMREERPVLYERVQQIESSKPKLQYSDEEWVERFEVFFKANERKPTATNPGTYEYNLARAYDNDFSIGGKRRAQLSPALESRMIYLEKQPRWRLRATTDETIKELQMFCSENKWFPLRTSPDDYERSLASRIAQTDRFTDEQREIIRVLRRRYSKNDRVSFPEKIFYQVMFRVLGEEVVANRKICNYEADISFPYKGCYYIIQYDGQAFHANEENILNDKKATRAHINGKNKVIRLREVGLPSLNDDGAFSPQEYCEKQIDPRNFTQESVNQIVSFIFARIGYLDKVDWSYQWEEIIKAARYDSSSRKTAINAVCEYLEYILFTEETPSRSSNHKKAEGVHLDMRIKALLNRGCFEEIDLEALALLESFYEPQKRKRNQKAFMRTGGRLEFENGSQFVR